MAVDALARALAAGKVPVSAYEMAVKAGYTGTEEQFAEDMGNSGTNAANAAASASAAAASAESVSASAAQIATNTSDISDLKTQIENFTKEENYDYSKVTPSRFAVSSLGLWSYHVDQESAVFAIPDKTVKIVVKGNDDNPDGSIIAFLNSYTPVAGNNVDFAPSHPSRIIVPKGQTMEFTVVDGMNYMYALLKTQSGVVRTPEVAIFKADNSNALEAQVVSYNAIDVFEYYNILEPKNGSHNGANYSWNGNVCTVTTDNGGTTNASVNTLRGKIELPDCVIPGDALYVKYNTTDPRVRLRIIWYSSDGTAITPYLYISGDKKIKVPENAASWTIQLHVSSGVEFESPVIVSEIKTLTGLSNRELSELIDREMVNETDNTDDPLYGLYDNHFHKIQLTPFGPMTAYKVEGGNVVIDEEENTIGTDMILCPKYLVFKSGTTSATKRENIFTKYSTPAATATSAGVTYTLSNDGETYTINGTATGVSWVNLMTRSQSVANPMPLESGKTYFVDVISDVRVFFRVYFAKDDGTINWNTVNKEFYTSGAFTVPSNYYGCAIRLYVVQQTAYNNAKVTFRLWNSVTRQEPSYDNARNIMMYFYSKTGNNYVRKDDVVYRVSSGGKLNLFNNSTLYNRVIKIPDNTYMQVSTDYIGEFDVYGWDGEHTGAEICGNAYDTKPINEGETSVLLPGTAKLLFSKSFAFNEVLGQPKGYPLGTETVFKAYGSDDTGRMCCDLPDGYDYFIAKFKKIDPLTPETSYVRMREGVYNGNLNSEIVAIGKTDIESAASGRAKDIIDVADALSKIEWTCMQDVRGKSDRYNFKAGVKYTGLPYVSRWLACGEVGWHISKHTFINATNDINSAFYNEHSGTDESADELSPGYGLVCTTFAEMCGGWPYPQVTDELLMNPDNIVEMCENPIPGSLLHNDGGHIVVPEMMVNADGIQEYIVYESINPCTTRVSRLSSRSDSNFGSKGDGEFLTYEYIHRYKYAIHRKDAVGYANSGFYDIYGGSITNGSARPYRGDRSVMTNLTGVKINIHNNSATKLYLQKCEYTTVKRIYESVPFAPGYFTPTNDSPIEKDINGADQITITDPLVDGAFYGCYTDADDTMEYFEYHSVQAGTYSKNESDFTFNVAKPFWYVIFSSAGQEQISGKNMYVSFPYADNDNYSKFRAAMNPADGIEGAVFYKGALGAYVAPLTAGA